MRSAVFVIASVLVLAIAIGAPSGRVIARETPPFNLEVILRDVTGGSGFGHVKFRQPNDGPQIVYLDTWVRNLAPNRAYELQRAVDVSLDGDCSSSGWLTLGAGPDARPITTNDDGTGREALWRSLAMLPAGATFDIHFQVARAGTTVAVLKSGCYRYTVR
jgi:hypothetical protein